MFFKEHYKDVFAFVVLMSVLVYGMVTGNNDFIEKVLTVAVTIVGTKAYYKN